MPSKYLTEDTTKKRYAVTLEFYVYAKDDTEVKKIAKDLAEKMDQKYDNQASIENITEVPWGIASLTKTRKVL